MINRFSVLFPIFFAAILAFVSYWVQISVENEKRENKLSNSPDYFLTNFKTIQTESNGAIRFILSANEMTHFAQDDTTRLKKPLFIRYKNNIPSSQIEGGIGLVSTDGEEVQIIDNVKIARFETEIKLVFVVRRVDISNARVVIARKLSALRFEVAKARIFVENISVVFPL